MKKKLKHITSGMVFRIIVGTMALLFIFEAVAVTVGYFQFTDSLTSEYQESAFRTAETAATLINGDMMETYLKKGKESYEYRNILSYMDKLCQKQNVTLIYAIRVDTSDYGHFRSVFNTVNENSGYTPWEVGLELSLIHI